MQATQAELAWNNGKTPEVLSGVTGIREYRVTQSDGAKLCRIQTEEVIGAGDKTRDLNREHHLLLAGGPYSAGSLGYHLGNKVSVPLTKSLHLTFNHCRYPLTSPRLLLVSPRWAWVVATSCTGYTAC